MRPQWAISCLVALGLAGGALLNKAQSAAQQLVLGKQIYAARCAQCHGAQGEGAKGPPLIGPKNNLSGYGTGDILFEYTRQVMPADRPGRLIEPQYWAVLAYILDANGLLPESIAKLGPENASQIVLDR